MTHRPGNVAVLLALVLPCSIWAAQEGAALGPLIPPAAKGEECVEPTDVMRRDHMRFLLHQRDETVHRGIRGAKHSLVGCIDCHAQTDAQGGAIPVDAEGQFCESCHSFAGVRMDCFECHAPVPAKKGTRGTLSRLISPLAMCTGKKYLPGVN